MYRVFIALCFILSAVAHAGEVRAATTTDANVTLDWCSYAETGNLACIQSAPAVAAAVNARVLASGGASTAQSLNTPAITGGTAVGTDLSASLSATSGATSGVTLAADWRRRVQWCRLHRGSVLYGLRSYVNRERSG